MSTNNVNHQQIVENLLKNKAVDFTAIGKAVAELGPAIAVANEPWDGFCGTMRTFVHIYKVPSLNNPVENLEDLSATAEEMRG